MKETTRNFYQDAVRAAVARIASGLDEALDLTALATLAGLSPLHFHRIFRGMLGETPLELHRRLRLERAAIQLATEDTNVTMIAFDAGFETHESFTRAFQAAHGAAPSQFRKRMNAHRDAMGRRDLFPFHIAARSAIHVRPGGGVNDFTIEHGEMNMDVIVEKRPALRVAAITHLGPRNMVGEAFRRLVGIAAPAGLLAQPGAASIAVFHDDPETTPAAELRTSAGVLVPGIKRNSC